MCYECEEGYTPGEDRELNIPAARKLLETVTADRERFKMDAWIKLNEPRVTYVYMGQDKPWIMDEGSCGTSACLAGWQIALDPEVVGFDKSTDKVALSDGGQRNIEVYAAEQLGLPQGVAHDLFYTLDDHCLDCDSYVEDECDRDGHSVISAEDHAISKLRKLIEEAEQKELQSKK